MLEERSSVSLVDIYNEIRVMREEARRQHRDTLYFAGFAVAIAVIVLGVSVWSTTQFSPGWQQIDAAFYMAIGFVVAAYLFVARRRLIKHRF